VLLNFTKKKWERTFLAGRVPPELQFDPFFRTISRLRARPDIFQYARGAEYLPDFLREKSRSRTWQECCHHRAEELLRLNRDQYLLSWSGGIDSTVMLVAMLEVWPEEALKRTKVWMSHSSFYENPAFFDQFVSRFSLASSMAEVSEDLLSGDTLLVTGELGDQLFGSDIMGPAAEALGDGVLRRNYQDWAAKVIDCWNRIPGSGNALFERFEPIVAECPFPVRTVFDFFWWFNFSQKWQHVKFRFMEDRSWNLNARYGEKVLHFFDTPDFQRWSIANHDMKIGKGWSSYKHAAKEYIFAFTKNREDLLLRKVSSLPLRTFLVEKRIAITADLTAVQKEEDLIDYLER
jgi:hypothetical protein